MKKPVYLGIILLLLQACGIYSFSGVNIEPDIKTYTVLPFQNNASLTVPGLTDEFRLALTDKIQQLTDLDYTDGEADLIYSGSITGYDVQPAASTADQSAALNRLTVRVKIDFTDNKHPDNNYSKTYSYFYDFPADKLLSDVQSEAHQIIIEQIVQDIFNDSLAKW
jgi:hypothetical protein